MMCYYVPLRLRLGKSVQRRPRQLLVLHGHGRREPRQVRRQHLFPRRRRADALRQPVHRLGTELEGQGARPAAGDQVSGGGRTAGWFSRAGNRSELDVNIRRPWWATCGFEIRVNGRPQAVAGEPSCRAVMRPCTGTGRRRHGRDRDAVFAPHGGIPRQPAAVRLPARPAGAVRRNRARQALSRGGWRGEGDPGEPSARCRPRVDVHRPARTFSALPDKRKAAA